MFHCEKLDQIAESPFFDLVLLSILCSPYAAFNLVQYSEGSHKDFKTLKEKF